MKIAEACVVCGAVEFRRHPAMLAPFIASRVFAQRPVFTVGNVLEGARSLRILRPIRPLVERSSFWKRPFPVLIGALHCRDCGLLFSDLRFDDRELGRVYGDYRGPRYVEDRDRYEPGYARLNATLGGDAEIAVRNANLEDVLARSGLRIDQIGVVLDYGGDEGQFIPAALSGARRIVCEVSDKQPRVGVEKVTGLAGLPPVDFAMICHVLEHVSEPTDMLARVGAALRPRGYVYVEVPVEMDDLDEPDALNPGLLTFHEHINHFCERSVARMLERAGFAVVFNETVDLMIDGSRVTVVSAVGRLAN